MFDKALLAVLKNGLNDPEHRNSVDYFTKHSADAKTIERIDPIIGSIAKSFNLSDIPINDVLKRSSDITTHPDQMLPICLKYNRKIDSSYFYFWSNLLDEKSRIRLDDKTIISIAPHLYRSLKCFSYQLESAMPRLATGEDGETIQYVAFSSMQFIIRDIFMFPTEIKSDFLLLLGQVLVSIHRQLPIVLPNSPALKFLNDLIEIVHAIAQCTLKQSKTDPTIKRHTQFIISVIYNLSMHKKLTDDDFQAFNDFVKVVQRNAKIIDSSYVTKAITSSMSILETVPTFKGDQTFLTDLANKSLTLITTYPEEAHKYAPSMVAYINWLVNTYIEADQIPDVDVPFPKERYDMECTDVLEQSLYDYEPAFDIYSPKNYDRAISQTIHSAFGTSITPLFGPIIKTKECAIAIARILARNVESPQQQLFLADFLGFLPPETMEIAHKENLYDSLLSKYLFGDIPDNDIYKIIKKSTMRALYVYAKKFPISDSFIKKIIRFVNPALPNQCNRVFEFVGEFFISNVGNTRPCLRDNTFGAIVIDADLYYKYRIVNARPDEDVTEWKHARTVAVDLMAKFIDNKDITLDFFTLTHYTDYIFHFLYEHDGLNFGIEALKYGLQLSVSTKVAERIFKFLNDAAYDGIRTMPIACAIINLYRDTFQKGYTQAAVDFTANRLEEAFGNYALTVGDDDTLESVLYMFFFYSNLHSRYTDRLEEVVISLQPAVSAATNRTKTVNLLASIALNRPVIISDIEPHPPRIDCPAALRLIYECFLHEPHVIPFLEYLMLSVSNVFMIFQSGLLLDIVKAVDESTITIVSRCLSVFCSMKELSVLFEKSLQEENKGFILKAVALMVERSIRFPQNMLVPIHVGVVSPSYQSLQEFTVSFMCRPKTEATRPALKISSLRERISVMVGDTVQVNIKDTHYDESFTLQSKRPSQKSLVSLTFDASSQTIKVGSDKDEAVFNIPFKFEFASGDALFYFERLMFDISDIKIDTRSPLSMRTVPMPLPIVYNMKEDGIEQLAGLFDQTHVSEIIYLFDALAGATVVDVTERFVEAYSYWLRTIDEAWFTVDMIHAMMGTTLKLSKEAATVFMRLHWLNFEMWRKFPREIQLAVIESINHFAKTNPGTFSECLDLGFLLTRLVIFYYDNDLPVDISCLEQGCKNATPEEASLMLDYALDARNEITLREKLMHLVYVVALSNTQIFQGALRFDRFFEAFNSTENMQGYALHMAVMAFQYQNGTPEMFLQAINRCVANMAEELNYEQAFPVAYGLSKGLQMWKASDIPSVTISESPIKYKYMLPLLVAIISRCEPESMASNAKIIIDEIMRSERSRKIVTTVPNWTMLLAFLGLYCNVEISLVTKAIAEIVRENPDELQNVYSASILLDVCSQWDHSVFFKAVLDRISSPSIMDVMHCLFRPVFSKTEQYCNRLRFFLELALQPIEILYVFSTDKQSVPKTVGVTVMKLLSSDMFNKSTFGVPNAFLAAKLIELACETGTMRYEDALPAYLNAAQSNVESVYYLKELKVPRQLGVYIFKFMQQHRLPDDDKGPMKNMNDTLYEATKILSVSCTHRLTEYISNSRQAYESMFMDNPYTCESTICLDYESEIERQYRETDYLISRGYAKSLQYAAESGLSSKLTIDHYRLITRWSGFGCPVFKPNHRYTNHELEGASRLYDPPKPESIHGIKPMQTSAMRKAEFSEECSVATLEFIYRGVLFVFKQNLIFKAYERYCTFGESVEYSYKVFTIPFSAITMALQRSYEHVVCGFEVFHGSKSLLLRFDTQDEMNRFSSILKARKVYVSSGQKVLKDMNIIKRWRAGEISTDEYLRWVNAAGGRSYSDLTQFPVFPWAGENESFPQKGKSSESIASLISLRPMSKTVGAMNEERYRSLHADFDPDGPAEASCHFRMFYSTAGSVVNTLMRVEPFMSLHIQLQNGHVDVADRLFASVPFMWRSVTGLNSDFRELCPHFYQIPAIFTNENRVDLGRNQKGEGIDTVELPWGLTDPHDFCAVSRALLERSRSKINEWVDLIFGVYQRGNSAREHKNDYHPYCYDDAMDKSPDMREIIMTHASNFGCVPQQVFTERSPKGGEYKRPTFNRPTIARFDCPPLKKAEAVGADINAVTQANKAIVFGKATVSNIVRRAHESMTVFMNDGTMIHRCSLLHVAAKDPKCPDITALGYDDGCIIYYRAGQKSYFVHRGLTDISVNGSLVASCGGGIVRVTEFPCVRARISFASDATIVALCECGVVCANAVQLRFFDNTAICVRTVDVKPLTKIVRFVRGFVEFVLVMHEQSVGIYEAATGRDVAEIQVDSKLRSACYWAAKDCFFLVLELGAAQTVTFDS